MNQGNQFSSTRPSILNRTKGAGLRIASVSLDGGAPQKEPLTTGNITISVTMDAPHTIAINFVNQYQVSLDPVISKALSSISSPTIPGDNYWYDSGTPVSLVLNGVYGRSSGSGSRLVSYSINGVPPTNVSTTATFAALSIAEISSPQTVTGTMITQYQLSTPTGSVASVTAPTLSDDIGWYDSGTPVSISYNYVWKTISQQSRLSATGYAIDGGTTTGVARVDTGGFNIAVTMNFHHTVDVKYVTQYYVSFQFTDAAGKRTIVPSALQITIDSQIQPVPGFTLWLDNGTSFTIASVTYEGVDVKPLAAQQYSVTAASAILIKDNVYDATVKVTDFMGFAVSGAGVEMTLANGTVVSGSTNADGSFIAPAIPLGTFTATISGIGSTAQVTGDSSKQSITPASILFSTTSLTLITAVILAVAGLAVFMLRRMSGRRAKSRMAVPKSDSS